MTRYPQWVSSASLFYLRHVRSCAASALGASGTGGVVSVLGQGHGVLAGGLLGAAAYAAYNIGKEWLGVMAWTSFAVWMFGPGGILELDTIIWMTLVLGPVFWMQLLTRQRAGRVTEVGGAMSSLFWNQADPINAIYEIADQVGGHAGHASRQLAAPARGMPWSWKFASMMGAPWGVRGEENESRAMVWPGHTEGFCLYDPELPDPDPFPLEIAFLAGAMVVLALLHVLLRWMYPNRWGPGRDVRIRRFFNSADITMGLAFAVTAGLGTGGRTTTCLWCVAVVCTLRSFGIHSPRPLCAIQTFFLGLGIGQRLLPAWNALMIGKLCWLVMSVVIILWALDVLPFGRSKDEKEDRYVSKLADLRPGATRSSSPRRWTSTRRGRPGTSRHGIFWRRGSAP
jgi:hypothetical protein